MLKNRIFAISCAVLLIFAALLLIPAAASQNYSPFPTINYESKTSVPDIHNLNNSEGITADNPNTTEKNITCEPCNEINSIASFSSQSERDSSERELSDVKDSITRRGAKWRAENTSISRMPKDEFMRMLGANIIQTAIPGNTQTPTGTGNMSYSTLPGTLDWRNTNGKDWTTSIRNQAGCGSCWAFGTLGAVESRVKIMTGDASLSPDYSEQELVSCAASNGCYGAYMYQPFNYMQNTGVVEESVFPYTSGSGSIPACPGTINSAHHKITSWTTLSGEANIKNALSRGPITATFDVYDDFRYYSGGVYEYISGSKLGSHAVTMIGWGQDEKGTYWICKNSWGSAWGESGWFRIRSDNVAINNYLIEATPDVPSVPVALVVGFTGSPRSGNAPLDVQFNDTSTGTGITAYKWIFSDSATEFNTKDLTHTFTTPGAYNVRHSATNSAGTFWKNETGYILVTEAGAAPTFSSINPTSGTTTGSIPVTIMGGNLYGATAVTFDGTSATGFTVVNGTSVTATTPAHTSGAVSVVVTTPNGTATGTGAYTYTTGNSPAVSGITPGSGVAGTFIKTGFITGTNFRSGATFKLQKSGQSNIIPQTVSVYNSNVIVYSMLTIPAGVSNGNWDAVVTNSDGTSGMKAAGFTITGGSNTPAPTFTRTNPTSGTVAGGTSVTITGTNLFGATAVTFGGTSATGVTVVSGTSITATTPVHAPGAVTVVVTTPNGTATGTGAYTYTGSNPAPTFSGINPTSGPLAGGTSVTITGTNLFGATAVTFDGTAATGVTVVSGTSITATTPVHASGAVNVVVTTPNGTATGTGAYTYTAVNSPTVSGIAPGSGVAGSFIKTGFIVGTNFRSGATFKLQKSGQSNITPQTVSVYNSTVIVYYMLSIPAGASKGTWDAVVTNSDGTSGMKSGGFTIL